MCRHEAGRRSRSIQGSGRPMTSEFFPLSAPAKVHHNTREVELTEEAIRRGEARFAASGALVVETGAHTGRSAQDKYTVRDATTEKAVWWDNNKPMTPEQFDLLWDDFSAACQDRASCSCRTSMPAPTRRTGSTRASSSSTPGTRSSSATCCAGRRRPSSPASCRTSPSSTCRASRPIPKRHGVRSQTVIACNFAKRLVLIGGTSYAGETKKSVFTFLNYAMPEKGVMPMHCSANVGPNGDAAVFFGLSGTGKTTLSADPKRTLLGDDEHGWSDGRHLQFRGRLLRQDHPPVEGGRARDLGRHQPLRRRAGERDPRSRPRACPTSTTAASPRTPAPPTRSSSSPTPARPAPPAIPRTSSC